MIDRFWGEEKDREAAKQLGLGDEYTIFLLGDQAEYAGAIDEVPDAFEGLTYASEVVDAVKDCIQPVILPGGLTLVGMRPVGTDGPRVYGVVDFTALGRG